MVAPDQVAQVAGGREGIVWPHPIGGQSHETCAELAGWTYAEFLLKRRGGRRELIWRRLFKGGAHADTRVGHICIFRPSCG